MDYRVFLPVLCVCQTQIGETFEKHVAVQQMIQNRQACLRKLADKQVRPVQLVAPRPENPPRSKSPFSPKHGIHTQTRTHTHTHNSLIIGFWLLQIQHLSELLLLPRPSTGPFILPPRPGTNSTTHFSFKHHGYINTSEGPTE